LPKRKEEMTELTEWSLTFPKSADPYQHPELRAMVSGLTMSGIVHGHPRIPDGLPVTTSCVVEFDLKHRRVVTKSGTKYRLVGPPDPGWVEFVGGPSQLGDFSQLVEEVKEP
jgi:hypothetical protein